MRINRGLVFWGVALITAGAVALAIQSSVIDGAQARELWRFWPVVLILIGLSIIAARTPLALVGTLVTGVVVGGLVGTLVSGWPNALSIGCGGTPDQLVSQNGTFGDRATVDLDFNCGDLVVSMADGDAWDVDAMYAGNRAPRITSTSRRLHVESRNDGFPGFNEGRQDWTVVLPRDVQLALEIDANASSSQLDLGGGSFNQLDIETNAGSVVLDLDGAAVGDLSIDANAGSVSITADGDSSVSGSVSVNAGSVELCVADGVGVAITIRDENITFSHNLDSSGLSRSGDTWSTSGTANITLRVSGNAASFNLNPEGGCS